MATNRLSIYNAEPFDASTEVDLNDVFLGDGSTTLFTLTQKTNLLLGATVQASNVQYYYYNGGFTKEGSDQFNLNSAPGSGVGIVAPGLSYLPFRAYDQAVVEGATTPLEDEIAFYLGNIDDIHLNKYVAAVDVSGISLTFVDHVSGDVIADETWMRLANATQDINGTASTYITGELLTSDFSAFCTLLCSVSGGGTTVTANTSGNADDFITGDYIIINKGGVNQEIRKFLGATGQALTVTELTYDHSAGETVYACMRKFWAKMIVPENATTGEATNFWNVGLRVHGTVESRV